MVRKVAPCDERKTLHTANVKAAQPAEQYQTLRKSATKGEKGGFGRGERREREKAEAQKNAGLDRRYTRENKPPKARNRKRGSDAPEKLSKISRGWHLKACKGKNQLWTEAVEPEQ